MSAIHRRQVTRACKRRGWMVQPGALQGILRFMDTLKDRDDQFHLDQTQDDDVIIEYILDIVKKYLSHQDGGAKNRKTLTSALWKDVLANSPELQLQDVAEESSRTHPNSTAKQGVAVTAGARSIEVVNAFETPKLVYETMRKQFRVVETKESLFGSADDKVCLLAWILLVKMGIFTWSSSSLFPSFRIHQTNMLAQRYALIHQRLLRHELFRPSNLGHFTALSSCRSSLKSQTQQHKLTPIESLLGKSAVYASSRTILLLGVLIQIEEGQYYLEDPTGQVVVSFKDAMAVDGFYVTERCILLVEGTFLDGIFYVHRLGHPLLETRDDSLAAIQQQVAHPAFQRRVKAGTAGANTSFDDDDDTAFVLVSDVQVDDTGVLQKLEGLFAAYENFSTDRLPVFILMGNFRGPSLSASHQPRTDVEELGNLIARFPNLADHAHFVLVPGPQDDAGQVLPAPNTLMRFNNNGVRIKHCHWATNPCRILWKKREMVIFRYDLLHLLQRQELFLQDKATLGGGLSEDDDSVRHARLPHCRLVKTILDQGHLVPSSANVPIFWNYDHALCLYPLPDVLVLGGDNNNQGFHEVYGDCNIIHPGSICEGNYALFSCDANDMSMETEGLDDSNDASSDYVGGVQVQFGKLGQDLEHPL